MVTQTYNPTAQEAETARSQVPGQPGLLTRAYLKRKKKGEREGKRKRERKKKGEGGGGRRKRKRKKMTRERRRRENGGTYLPSHTC